MTERAEILRLLQRAAEVSNTNLIVRSQFAIAEVRGPLALHCTGEWLRLGVEGESHIHLKLAAVKGLQFQCPPDANAGVRVCGEDGELLCRIVFRQTNPKLEGYDAGRAASVKEEFSAIAV